MHNLRIISKVTPVFPSDTVLEEYIISEDFYHPSTYFNYKFKFTSQETDIQPKKNVPYDSTFSDCLNYDEICPCILNLAFVKLKNRIKVKIDAILFSVIMLELKRSRTFRFNFLRNVFSHYIMKKKLNVHNFCLTCEKNTVVIHAIVYLRPPKKNVLDKKWNKRIQILVNEKCELENAMAWLSTLGGAFSALGDTYVECALKAGIISLQQFRIALRLGDPLTICRCKIYLAMSLLQRGYFSRTKRIIRELYEFATEGEGARDFRLKNMCIAVWNRLKYLKSQKTIKEK